MATPEDRSPYRGKHEPGEERTVTHVHSNGETYRMVLRQVGWHGQSGAFYALGESPHLYETGSYQTLWIIAHADQLDEEGNPT